MRLTFTAPVELTAERASRRISGVILPYGVVGHTSAGPLRIRAGAIRVPDDLARVKLLEFHSPAVPGGPIPRAAGYATAINDDAAGLSADFHIARTPAGDEALAEASERTRDAFSVELHDIETEGDEVVSATLTAVAQITVPAYDGARVASVAATHTANTEDPMPQPTTAPAAATEPPTTNAPAAQHAAPETAPPAASPAPTTTAHAAAPATVSGDAPAPAASAAAAPWAAPRSAPTRRELTSLYAAMSSRLTGQPTTPDVAAALADITNSENPWIAQTAYSGQLWSGVSYQREIVPLLNSGSLTSYKGVGWRWKTKPEVATYAGDKLEVPSNEPETEESPYTASRLAGAHDLDRKFWDFGDTEFIRAYYEAMTESYAYKSDVAAATWIATNAVTPAEVVAPVEGFLRAVGLGAAYVKRNTRSRASFVIVNDMDMLTLLDYTKNTVPAFLELLGITPDRFVSSELVDAGAVLVGTRQTATFRELQSSPIRVETINLANGGIDGGVFGYYAIEEHHTSGIVEIPWVAAADEGAGA